MGRQLVFLVVALIECDYCLHELGMRAMCFMDGRIDGWQGFEKYLKRKRTERSSGLRNARGPLDKHTIKHKLNNPACMVDKNKNESN